MRILRTEKAFTLVEVMTALLILSVGMLGVAAMFTTSLRSDNYNAYAREAENLAGQKIEELRGKSVDGTLATSDSADTSTNYTLATFCYTWTVTPDTDTTRRICQVEVFVGWPTDDVCKSYQVGKCSNRLRLIAFIPQK